MKKRIFIFPILLISLTFGTKTASAQLYEIREIGTLQSNGMGSSYAYGINASDMIVGAADADAGRAAFRLKAGGALEDLGFIGSASFPRVAFAINANGVVAGCGAKPSRGV